MMLFKSKEESEIIPYESTTIDSWAKKWGVQTQQLNEAIVSTGSLQVKVIKNYLEQKGDIISVTQLPRYFTSRVKNFFSE
jgi:hypothetical protein